MGKEISKAQREAVARYEAKAYDKTLIRLPKGKLDEIREAAEKEGKSLNGYISLSIEVALGNEAMTGAVKLAPEAIEDAEKAAKKAGETLPEYITRAIQDTAIRDEQLRKIGIQKEFLGHKGES